MRPIAQLLLALLPSAVGMAQTAPNLLGPTLSPVALTPLILQTNHAACTQLGSCATTLPANLLPYWPGGSAYDSGTTSAWATTGAVLARYDVNTCAVNCGPLPCPRSAGSQATGLDIHDGLNQLWTIDSLGIITRSTNNCALGFITSHNTGLTLGPGPTATTGITIDELRGLVFYSTANFAGGSGTIYVAPLANPGAWYQSVPVTDCFNNPQLITGLAVDAANSRLYWTDGRGTIDWTYTVSGGIVTFTMGTCCIQATPFQEPLTDLSIRWGGARSAGVPCANGACPPCPMQHTLRNAPLLGTTLQLGLDLGPTSTPIWNVLSIGVCSGGTVAPPVCGPVLVPLNPTTVTLPFLVTNPGVGCTGSVTFLFPLPALPSLVGLPMASQCIGLCPPTGTTLSNCLSFFLQ